VHVFVFQKKKTTSKPEIPNQTQTLSNHSHSLAIFEKIQTLNKIKYNEQENNNNKQALISKNLGSIIDSLVKVSYIYSFSPFYFI